MTSSEEFVFDDTKLKGCWIEWTFDSYFSADVKYSHDKDHNNYYDKDEIVDIYNNAFINLKNYYYFIFIRQGNKRTNPDRVYNFTAKQLSDGTLVYRFYIDLSEYEGNELYLAVYDYTFFCDIRYPDNSVSFNYDKSKLKVSYTIDENTDYPVYYDPLGPATDTTVHYKWHKGLQVYYPREIHIKYN